MTSHVISVTIKAWDQGQFLQEHGALCREGESWLRWFLLIPELEPSTCATFGETGAHQQARDAYRALASTTRHSQSFLSTSGV